MQGGRQGHAGGEHGDKTARGPNFARHGQQRADKENRDDGKERHHRTDRPIGRGPFTCLIIQRQRPFIALPPKIEHRTLHSHRLDDFRVLQIVSHFAGRLLAGGDRILGDLTVGEFVDHGQTGQQQQIGQDDHDKQRMQQIEDEEKHRRQGELHRRGDEGAGKKASDRLNIAQGFRGVAFPAQGTQDNRLQRVDPERLAQPVPDSLVQPGADIVKNPQQDQRGEDDNGKPVKRGYRVRRGDAREDDDHVNRLHHPQNGQRHAQGERQRQPPVAAGKNLLELNRGITLLVHRLITRRSFRCKTP